MEPLDFVVQGFPRTSQTKSSKSRQVWREAIRVAAAAAQPSGADLLQGELSAQIVYFYTDSTSLDVDNIIKPILDALTGLVFEDDSTIFQVTCRKTLQADGLIVRDAPSSLIRGLEAGRDFVYVRIGAGPDHTELPS